MQSPLHLKRKVFEGNGHGERVREGNTTSYVMKQAGHITLRHESPHTHTTHYHHQSSLHVPPTLLPGRICIVALAVSARFVPRPLLY